jgi:hypothetical protein
MTTAIQKAPEPGALAAQIVIQGDLSQLSDHQLSTYYVQLCDSLALNPSTRPFTMLKLNGKLVMYANRDCCDQLRKRDKVSVRIVKREEAGELLIITAQAQLPDGRVDEAIGALPLGKLQGEARANALMKCETKAKRRVTLSICGLGFMDESEVEAALSEDHGTNGERMSPHAGPGESVTDAPKQSDRYDAILKSLLAIDEWIARKGTISYQDVLTMREQVGTKAKPSTITRQISEMVNGGEISPSQRAELGKLWNRLDRQIVKLEGTIQGPPIEATIDREPGDDSEEDPL